MSDVWPQPGFDVCTRGRAALRRGGTVWVRVEFRDGSPAVTRRLVGTNGEAWIELSVVGRVQCKRIHSMEVLGV